MKLTLLRRFVKEKFPPKVVDLNHQNLVIDGDYFRHAYKNSLCPYIVGGEYDRYANYLRSTMSMFVESDITCYVVFKGAMDTPIESRLEIHQKIINKTDAVLPGREENEYCEPIFVKDVIKEVLKEFGIKYHVCTYDEKETLFTVARHFNCPILTCSVEYTIFRVSCIPPNSITFDKSNKLIRCKMFGWERLSGFFPRSYRLLAILLSTISDDATYYSKIPGIIGCQEYKLVQVSTEWIRKKDPDYAIQSLSAGLREEEQAELLSNIKVTESLFHQRGANLAVKILKSQVKESNQAFEYMVATGKVATPYINLKYKNTFSGSWLIADKDKPDAMISAMDIVFYSYARLTGAKHLKIKFIGRQNSTSKEWDIHKSIRSKPNKNASYFQLFLDDHLPGFNMNFFRDSPEDCWLLLTILVFYNLRSNFAFTNGAYAIILSYVMLSVVSNRVGLIKRSNVTLFNPSQNNFKDENGILNTDCLMVANKVLNLFYISEQKLKENFSREILHSLAEYQHCLQHVNYLNSLCGGVKATCYHKAINMTFVYNVILTLNAVDSPMAFVEDLIECPSIFSFYKSIVDGFLECQRNVK